jgi:hypothetical protein
VEAAEAAEAETEAAEVEAEVCIGGRASEVEVADAEAAEAVTA